MEPTEGEVRLFSETVSGLEVRLRDWLAETNNRVTRHDFSSDVARWTTIHASLPNYRLTKFQPLMPDWVERETIAKHLLDIDRARVWLAGLPV